ncbi:MAG: biopolymer transporter ExbD [Halieaceae bacterium]|nr:biopolymer transporter ExbD [Halieaceae bacterium]
MKFRRPRLQEAGVNLTPLIDVVFLLLIFFMVSTTFVKTARLQIELPEAAAATTVDEPEQIEILIDESGRYRVNSRQLANSGLAALKSAISQEARGDTSIPLLITADALTRHQAVVRAMDAAGQLGFVHLGIATIQSRSTAEESP